jgi:hypothetical protein
MKSRASFVMCSAVIASILAFSATPSMAQKTAKACEDEWKAGKADIQKSGKKKKDFIAECRGSAAATPAAAPAATAKPAAPAATPAATPTATTSKPSNGRQAEYARERACGQDWKAEKAAGKVPAGMTWPKYWSECNKGKKAAGM